jgi:tetratricopeptide (TPR) repeat protein
MTLSVLRSLAPVVVLLAPGGLRAQSPGATTVTGLGTLTFPVSSRVPAARSAFVRGALLLHLFEYPAATQAFREAERLDPNLAMAYWGEAMTYTHPVWNEQDVDAGRRALEQLAPTPAERAATAATARERGYLGAVELLYGEGTKAHRDTLYAAAMQGLARAYPADDEARLFFALSLLGLSEGVRNVPTYLQAAAIAESVLARNPHHPGAAHYLIHAVDDPDHAARGLGAAQALAQIAPVADHAQHMTSHIFMALGLWEDVVRANETATRLVDDRQRRGKREPISCRHYNVWLDYGYLQLGRIADATRLLERCRAQAARAPRGPETQDPDAYSLITMWSHYVFATGSRADSVALWSIDPGPGLGPRLVYAFTRGFGAARRGDGVAARAALDEFRQAQGETERWVAASGDASPEHPELQRARALRAELEGLIAFVAGDTAQALVRLGEATAIEDSMVYAFGPPFVNEPSHELLGTELLRLKRFAAAQTQFGLALKRAPRRTAALLGLARASAARGDPAAAWSAYAELAAIWQHADPGQPVVLEAQEYARLHGRGESPE